MNDGQNTSNNLVGLALNGNTATATMEAPAPTSVMCDAFGTEIRKGDIIVFAVRKASRQWLNKLRVTGVTSTSVRGYDPLDQLCRNKTLKQMKTVVVLISADV
jgi:hypothetical protein